MEEYELSPIKNILDALEVRKIRNQGRISMTKDTSEITSFTQVKWYFKTYKEANKKKEMICYLFRLNGKNSGFGFIRKTLGKYWITGGISTEQRGKGLGKILFGLVVKEVPSKTVWLEVLDSNIFAKKIYFGLGFKKIKTFNRNGNKILLMNLIK